MKNTRYFSKIELEDENLKLTFIDRTKEPIVAEVNTIEIIKYCDYGYMSIYGRYSGELNATFEDWKELMSLAEKSTKFVFCGDKSILVLDNVLDCNKVIRRGSLVVDCKKTSYEIELYGEFEKANDLEQALHDRWHKHTTLHNEEKEL